MTKAYESSHGAPRLLYIGGLAGVGKSSCGELLKSLDWTVFDKDVLSRPFVQLVGSPSPESNQGKLVRAAEYEMLAALVNSLDKFATLACVVAPFVEEFCNLSWVDQELNKRPRVELLWIDAPPAAQHFEMMSRRNAYRDREKIANFSKWRSQALSAQLNLDNRVCRFDSWKDAAEYAKRGTR